MAFDLSNLDGTNGFTMSGGAFGQRLGSSVASAGDVDGDGIEDFIITDVDRAYVVYGRSGGFGADFDPTNLDGSNGFTLSMGAQWNPNIASAGDINGDGRDDIIIGLDTAAPGGNASAGQAMVFLSQARGSGASFDLTTLDGDNGFIINGGSKGDRLGSSVSSAGDINGDGFDDIIVGANRADPFGSLTDGGISYVIFGSNLGFDASMEVSDLNGVNGFQAFHSSKASALGGSSVANLGDVNGDGIDDFVVGASGANDFGARSGNGVSYVVFGGTDGFDLANVNELRLNSLDGTNGFKIVGSNDRAQSGFAVSAGGDFNGDGINDIAVSAPGLGVAGRGGVGGAYLIFGSNQGFGPFVDSPVSNLITNQTGFQIFGDVVGDQTGYSVAGAGDFNGDGFDDLIIGAHTADNGGLRNSGSVYVVYGRGGASSGSIDLRDIDPNDGFRIDGVSAGGLLGREVAGIGDVNNDGFSDILVAAPLATINGIPVNINGQNVAGEGYVLYGTNTLGTPGNKPQLDDEEVNLKTSEVDNITIDVLSGDFSPLGLDFEITGNTLPSNGQVTLNPDGTFTYTPFNGFIGVDSFTYTVTDENGSQGTAKVTINVAPTDPPVANDDTATVTQNTAGVIDVLANDSDPEGGALTIQSVGTPNTGGSVSVQDGQILFTPDTDFIGTSTFTYTVADPDNGIDTGTVTVTVAPPTTEVDVDNFTSGEPLDRPDGYRVDYAFTIQQEWLSGDAAFDWRISLSTPDGNASLGFVNFLRPNSFDGLDSSLVVNQVSPGVFEVEPGFSPALTAGTQVILRAGILDDNLDPDAVTITFEDLDGGANSNPNGGDGLPPVFTQDITPSFTQVTERDDGTIRADMSFTVTQEMLSGNIAADWQILITPPSAGGIDTSFFQVRSPAGYTDFVNLDGNTLSIKDGEQAPLVAGQVVTVRMVFEGDDLTAADLDDVSLTFADIDLGAITRGGTPVGGGGSSEPGSTNFTTNNIVANIASPNERDNGARGDFQIQITQGMLSGDEADSWSLTINGLDGARINSVNFRQPSDITSGVAVDVENGVVSSINGQNATLVAGDILELRILFEDDGATIDVADLSNVTFTFTDSDGNFGASAQALSLPIQPLALTTTVTDPGLPIIPSVTSDVPVEVTDFRNYGGQSGFKAELSLTLTDDLLQGDSLSSFTLDVDLLGGGSFTAGRVKNGLDQFTDFDASTGTFSYDGNALKVGDVVVLEIRAAGADFDADALGFSFGEDGAAPSSPVTTTVTSSVATPEPSSGEPAGATLVNSRDWGSGFRADFEVTITNEMLDGGSASDWTLDIDLSGGGSFVRGRLLNGLDDNVDFNLATGTFSVKDGASEVLRAGDTIALSVQVDGAGFAGSEFAFDFSDNDGFSIA